MNLAYPIHLGTSFAITLISVGSMSVLLGGIGVCNLAHIGTVAVGAYASALLALRFGFPAELTIIGAAAAGVLWGLLLALLLRRVRGDYLALLALSVYTLTIAVLLNWPSVTRGALGLPGIPRPVAFASPPAYLAFTASVAVVVLTILATILRSPYGRVMAAIRDDETAALALGKRVGDVRMVAYLVASAAASVSGALLAHHLRFIDPLSFPLLTLALVLAGTIVGGAGSPAGMVAGAAIVTFVPEIFRFLRVPPTAAGPLRQMLFAAIILGVLFLRPRGIFGRVDVR